MRWRWSNGDGAVAMGRWRWNAGAMERMRWGGRGDGACAGVMRRSSAVRNSGQRAMSWKILVAMSIPIDVHVRCI